MKTDLSTRSADLEQKSLKLWLELSSIHTMVENTLKERLRKTYGTTLPRFNLLIQLEQYPDGLKMGELSERLMVSNGNITSITNQLEKLDYITRVSNKKDKRSTFIKITQKGEMHLAELNKDYNAWIEELMKQFLNEQTQDEMYYKLNAFKQSLYQHLASTKANK